MTGSGLKPKVLLIFDIDGTLTLSGGASGRALGAAFVGLTGVDVGPGVKQPYGMTDAQIFREMLKSGGIQTTDFPRLFQEFQERYFPLVREELQNTPSARLLPGVRELLAMLSQDDRVAMALGTGNLEISGREKLKFHGVDHYFPVGGFGSDAEDRVEVLKIAVERARKHWNTEFQPSNTWVIGDTGKDISSGKAIGAKTIAVATGMYSVEELRKSNPDVALKTLEDPEGFLDIVMSS